MRCELHTSNIMHLMGSPIKWVCKSILSDKSSVETHGAVEDLCATSQCQGGPVCDLMDQVVY